MLLSANVEKYRFSCAWRIFSCHFFTIDVHVTLQLGPINIFMEIAVTLQKPLISLKIVKPLVLHDCIDLFMNPSWQVIPSLNIDSNIYARVGFLCMNTFKSFKMHSHIIQQQIVKAIVLSISRLKGSLDKRVGVGFFFFGTYPGVNAKKNILKKYSKCGNN